MTRRSIFTMFPLVLILLAPGAIPDGMVPVPLLARPALAADKAVDAQPRMPAGVPAAEVIDGEYLAAGPRVEISGTVNGDVYAAGGQILIDGSVNGDVLVVGGSVTLSGHVAQDVRVLGGRGSDARRDAALESP
jgi:hypothetical protein